MAIRTQSKKTAPAEELAAEMSKDELLKAYRMMLLIRRFEEKAGQLYGMGFVGSFATFISVRKQ